jgi:adenine-specific DNA methylase
MTRRLIENWLPIAALGIESLRERTPMTPFPAPNRLHVWWARRPLVAARAAILASLLPVDGMGSSPPRTLTARSVVALPCVAATTNRSGC